MKEQANYRTCPYDSERIKIIILNWPNNNVGTVVMCNKGNMGGRCPKGRRYVCEFQFTESD
jgi:hypothetical protein